MTLWKTFCRILDIDENQQEWNVTPDDVPYWTSLLHINLLMEIDLLYGTDMVGQLSSVRCYEDIKKHASAVNILKAGYVDQSLGPGILFIGECCAKNVFLLIKQLIRQHDIFFDKRLFYQDTGQLIRYFSSKDRNVLDQRIQMIHGIIEGFVRPWAGYLNQVDTVVYSQIFQLSKEDNFVVFHAVKTCIDSLYPNMKWVFLPTPLPGYSSDFNDLNFKSDSGFLQEKVIEFEGFKRCFPEVHCVDSVKMMSDFYEVNTIDSFHIYAPEYKTKHNYPKKYCLDPFHYIYDFWLYLCTNIFYDELIENKTTDLHTPPIPNVSGTINACYELMESLLDTDSQETEFILFQNHFGAYLVRHVVKKLWYDRTDLRIKLITWMLESDSGILAPLMLWGHNWISIDDLNFDESQIRTMDHLLSIKTENYSDLSELNRYFRVVGIVLAYSVIYPEFELLVSGLMQHHDSSLSIRDPQLYEKLSEYAKFKEEPVCENVTLEFSGIRDKIISQISRRLHGDKTWAILGAGSLAEMILLAVNGKLPRPLACFSSFPHQTGTCLMGIPVLSFNMTASIKPDLLVIGTGQVNYPLMVNKAQEFFPGVKIAPPLFYKKTEDNGDVTKNDLPGHETFFDAMKNTLESKRFRLIWRQLDSGEGDTVYSLKHLISWGCSFFHKHNITQDTTPVLPMILPTSPAVYALFYAAVWKGIVPSILSYPTDRRSKDDYTRQLDHVLKNLDVTHVVTDSRIAGQYPSEHVSYLIWDDCFKTDNLTDLTHYENEQVKTDNETLFIQHSSGTTGIQKAVGLSVKKVMSQARAYGKAAGITDKDIIATWLPLYHDMGLLTSLICPVIWGIPVVACDPREWVMSPGMILDMIETYRATLTWWPNFTFSFLANTAGNGRKNHDLSSMRMIVNCSEPVTHEAVSRFEKAFFLSGITGEKIGASYAMAENTFALSQTEPGRGCLRIHVDESRFRKGWIVQKQGGKTLVSSGRLLDHADLVIAGEDGTLLGEGRIGELCIRSSSLFDGYHVDRRKLNGNEALFSGGYYKTGDLGCVIRNPEGQPELFVTGRKKDMIIIAGENYYPHDIEQAVEDSIADIRKGRTVAAGVFNHALQTETLAVRVETVNPSIGEDHIRRIKKQIRDIVYRSFDIKTIDVDVLPPGTLVKSSSGKIARKMSLDVLREGNVEGSSNHVALGQ